MRDNMGKGLNKIGIISILIVIIAVASVVGYLYVRQQPVPTPTPTPTPTKSEILIGGSFCLSGALGKSGQDFLKAIRLAISIINEEGGVYIKEWNVHLPIRLIYYDSKSDAVTATSDTERLIMIDHVDFLLGTHGSILGTAISNVANKYGVILLGDLGSTLNYEVNNHKYTFTYFSDVRVPTPEQRETMEKLYGKEAVEDFVLHMPIITQRPMEAFVNLLNGTIKVAMIMDDDDLGHMMADELHRLVNMGIGVYKNVTIVYETFYTPGLTDFSSIILEAKETDANYLFGAPNPMEGVILLQQMRELGWHIPVVHLQRASSASEFQEMAGSLVRGLIGPAMPEPTGDPFFEKFKARFNEMYGRYPMPTEYGPCIHILLLKDAIERAGSLNTEKVRQALAETNKTIFGSLIRFPLGCGHSVVDFYVQQYRAPFDYGIIYPPEVANMEPIFPKPWD
jgi:branched-chain amino acid transport system substrate-binding protein